MPESPILAQLALALLAAAAGGIVAARLRLPLLVGYIAGGVLLGPGGFGLIRDPKIIQALADLGIVLLLFALGVEFRLDEVRSLGPVALRGGAVQIALTLAAVVAVALAAGLGWRWGLVWGCLVALSSTAVCMRGLAERGETDATHGRLAAGFLIVQDVAVVPMAILITVLGRRNAPTLQGLTWRHGLSVLVIAVILVGATRLLPKLLHGVSAQRDREIYLLAVIGVGLLVALASAGLGLSLGLGAFIAGLVLSESPYAQMALGGILPLRDCFASLFFVSLGLMFRPGVVLSAPLLVLLALLAILAVKTATPWLAMRLQRQPRRLSMLLAASLVPLGEFNLMLATQALGFHLIGPTGYDLLVLVTLLTAAISPLAMAMAARRPGQDSRLREPLAEPPLVKSDVVLIGLGRVGLTVAENLQRWGTTVTAIDLDQGAVAEARRRGVRAIWGDATEDRILASAGVDDASLLITTLPDATSNEIAIRLARRVRPDLRVIARAHRGFQTARLDRAGADLVIEPEFEGAITLLRAAVEPLGRSHHRLGEAFARIRARNLARTLLHAGQPDRFVADCTLAAGHPWIGLPVAAIEPDLPARLLGVVRNDGPILSWPPDMALQEGDELLLDTTAGELPGICRLLAPARSVRL
jgi:CPA2 family monovalent cation:H+ antiporter-2